MGSRIIVAVTLVVGAYYAKSHPAYTAPGKAYRGGLSFFEVVDMLGAEATARRWFERECWPDGPFCRHCGSFNVQSGIKHKAMTHRCRDCPKKRTLSLKTGTVMHGSKLSYRVWG